MRKYNVFECPCKTHLTTIRGVSLQKFVSDGGGEYVSKKFLNFCKARGIEKHLTVPYTPQQNGVAERMNRTLMEMTQSMLYHAN